MQQLIGDFIEPNATSREYLCIHFSPTSVPLLQRWRNSGLSADFVADYWTSFFPAYDVIPLQKYSEIKGSINYITNELLENMSKFSYRPADYPVNLGVYLYENMFRFYTYNAIDLQVVEEFQVFIQKLLTEDADALYMQQLQINMADKSGASSRLGLLTMINDYDARLAWKFETDHQDIDLIFVTTMVQLVL